MKLILKATESITGKNEASLYVSTIGLEEQQKPIVRPHGLPVYQIFYCTAGSGELVVNEERYCIEAGNGFFLKANEMHSYYKTGSEWRLSYLGFQGTLCEPLLETYGLTKSGAFKVSADQRFMKEFRQLYEYLETFGEQDSAEVSKLCYGCLLEILETMNWIDVGKNAESDEVIERIMEYLQKEFGRAITLDELSAVVGLSKEYMCSYFKKKMNKTIMQVLCDIRIMNACVMLNRFPDKKIAEISKKCGFESPSYFGAVFRKHQGMTPDTYRKWIPIEHK